MALIRHKTETDPLNAPLLSPTDIIELMHRAQRLHPSAFNRETAYRQPGENPSSFRGIGPDYEESRLYQPGDDLRHMNWRLSARSSDHYIKVFREERQPGTFILVDRRASMRFGTRVRLKVTQSVRAAIMLAFAAQASNRAVGAVVLEPGHAENRSSDDNIKSSHNFNKPLWIRNQSNHAGIQHLIDTINRPCPPVPENTPQPSLPETLKLMLPMLTRGSNVILISDFIDLDPDDNVCRTLLAHLAADHNLGVIQIIDRGEQVLPDAGKLRLQSAPGQQPVTINTSSTETGNAWATTASEHFDARQQLFKALNIPCVQLLTDVDRIDDVLQSLT